MLFFFYMNSLFERRIFNFFNMEHDRGLLAGGGARDGPDTEFLSHCLTG